MISRSLNGVPVSTWLLRFTEAGGDLGVFCYRMGVDVFSAGRAQFGVAVSRSIAQRSHNTSVVQPSQLTWAATRSHIILAAQRPQMTRIQVACSNLFSTFSVRFSTLKD